MVFLWDPCQGGDGVGEDILSSGGFATSCFKTMGNGVPRSSMPWVDTCTMKFRQLNDHYAGLCYMLFLLYVI